MKTPQPHAGKSAADDGRGDLYSAAADLAKESLEDQASQLSGMRTRAVQFLSFVGTATAFLVGTALTGEAKFGSGWSAAQNVAFNILIVAGAAGFLFVLVLLRALLMGTKHWYNRHGMVWHYQKDATAYTEWLDERCDVDAVTFYRQLAKEMEEQRRENKPFLDITMRRYVVFLAMTSALLFFWGAIAVYFGSGR